MSCLYLNDKLKQLISIGAKHRAEYKERKKYINKKARPKLIVIGTIFAIFLLGITISLMRQGSVTHQACNAYRKVLTISGKMTDDEWRNQLNGMYLIALDSHDPSMVKAGHQLLSEITTFDPYVLDNAGHELAKACEDLKNDDSH